MIQVQTPTPLLHPLVGLVQSFWKTSPPLVLTGMLMAVLGVFFLVGIFLDPRYITGIPAWLKPFKFTLSIALYSFTLVWMLGFIEGHRRLVNFLGWAISSLLTLEIVIIGLQAFRGLRSHYNVATPLDALLYSAMGIAIMVVWLATLAIAVLLVMQKFRSSTLALALRLGIFVALVGIGEAFLMTLPTALQLADAQAGKPLSLIGAHSMGVVDGGPGLPFVNWSTTGGDLRIGHFVGMHALQVLPFVGWLVGLLGRRYNLSQRQEVGLVWTAGLGYLGLTALVTWQALRAQPITAPDGLTIGVFALLLSAMGMAVWWIFRQPRAQAVHKV